MGKRNSARLSCYKYPHADTLKGRSSTLRRAMACSLMERVPCTNEMENEWKKFFPKKICAYCGEKATHLDHLYALIDDKIPTGYCTEPQNLVPCCGRCNQQKGNDNYEDFIKSVKCKNKDSDEQKIKRIEIIKEFQKKMPAKKIHIPETMLSKWKELRDELESLLTKANEEIKSMHEELYGDETTK